MKAPVCPRTPEQRERAREVPRIVKKRFFTRSRAHAMIARDLSRVFAAMP